MCPPCPPCPPVQSEDQLYANHKNNFGDVRQKVRSTGGLSGDSAVTGHILPAPSIHSTLCRLHTVYCAPRQSRCLMINMLRVVPILHSSNSRGFNQKQIFNIQYTIRSNHNQYEYNYQTSLRESLSTWFFSRTLDHCRAQTKTIAERGVETKPEIVRWGDQTAATTRADLQQLLSAQILGSGNPEMVKRIP